MKPNEPEPKTKGKKSSSRIPWDISLICILCITLFTVFLFKINRAFAPADLMTVEGTLTEKPRLGVSPLGGKMVKISINEYPDYIFTLSGHAFSSARIYELTTEMEKNNPVKIKIKPSDYDRLIREKSFRGFYRLSNDRPVSAYEVTSRQHTYLSESNYRHTRNYHNQTGIFLLWIAGIAGTAYLVKKKSRIHNRQEK